MSKSFIGRIWNRIESRYTQESESECCGPTIEEVPADEGEEDSESCCS